MIEIAFTAIAFLCACAYVGWAYGWDAAAVVFDYGGIPPTTVHRSELKPRNGQ